MEPKSPLKVGIFVLVGVTLLATAILTLGGLEGWLKPSVTYRSYFSAVDGLVPGAKVMLNGIRVGVVKSMDFDAERQSIRVGYDVESKLSSWVRQGTTAEIATQGVLGDKYIALTAGAQNLPAITADSELPVTAAKDFTQMLGKGDQLLHNLNSVTLSVDRILKTIESQNRAEAMMQSLTLTSRNLASISTHLNQELTQSQLKSSLVHLNEILRKVNQGTGTIGALVNDPSLYDDVKALFGGANRNRVMRNLVRDTVKRSEEAPK